ncbi:uncharacterized protein MEPE_05248 [Melanopsichium pennsylvanicum]|uniref:Eukaryotic translation initiation factor 3 subunit J n=2 Tax=Melanopsichium pennsylvanicum TaxID=63383 RepID=A0AAJ4XQC1_9BASI|nr:translation initiation factor eif3 subunit [Melanopsichium pennsylvanicum 4]SNX86539.1 uncharacterized protein MEPE_05248 [Melanopsichium pennsylvanicum]
MSDWENDDEPQQPIAPVPKLTQAGRKKFDDEDVEDEVKDDWEEEDSEPEAPKTATVLPPRKKKSVKQKIAEKEEEERLRREQGLEEDDDDEEEDLFEDPIAKKRMEREAQLKSDVENAANLFGITKIGDDGLNKLKSANPTSKEDWESFATDIFTELIKKKSTQTGFEKHFVPFFFKQISSTLRDVDIRKTSTMLKTYAEEKVKAEKEAKKTGGNKLKTAVVKPKTVGTASAKNVIDTKAYGDEALDDDLDFM